MGPTENVRVATRHGYLDTPAYSTQCEFLMVHRSLAGDLWSITHIPTGHYCAKVDTLRDGREFARRLRELDWNFRSPRSSKMKALGEPVRKVLGDLRAARNGREIRR